MSVRVFTLAALLAATTVIGGLPAEAQTRYREPAEFPPASFTGSQFVDSRGCVFVRAGIAGSTTWVPRVTSSRQNLCGAQPSFPRGTSQTAAAPPGALPPGAVVITANPPATATAQTPPAAAPQPPRRAEAPVARPAPQTARINARQAPQPPVPAARVGEPMRTVASVTTPPTIGMAATQPARAAAPAPAITVDRCGPGMRCGPQAQNPVGQQALAAQPARPVAAQDSRRASAGLQRPAPGTVVRKADLANLHPDVRVVPRHVAEAQAASVVGPVPQGYRPVWTDDRLNPRRAHGTAAGYAATDLIWTDTVPRRLIDRRTGQDMTAANPNLVYPFTDLATQVRQPVLGQTATLSASGRAAPATQPRVAKAQTLRQTQEQAQPATPRVSTRAAAPAPAPAPARQIAGRFVQIGAFADPANAQRTIQRLQAAGLPVSVQRSSSKGKPVQVILAGPFETQGALAQGLDRSRAAGFRDAFARN
jgi:cell division septation protein DedD